MPMTLARDLKFLDYFSHIFGILVGLFVGVILLAIYLASRS
jgi:hypothetical protein